MDATRSMPTIGMRISLTATETMPVDSLGDPGERPVVELEYLLTTIKSSRTTDKECS
jgi:hypothetical protein